MYNEFLNIVKDILKHPDVQSLKNYKCHRTCNLFLHSISVAFFSFAKCKKLGLDYVSAARGALLHDFYLYNWRIRKLKRSIHGKMHPYYALANAYARFSLNEIESDIILKHMWPFAKGYYKYAESRIVSSYDKHCAIREFLGINKKRLQNLFDMIE